MSINEACHSSQSVSTIPIPSVLLLKPVTNSDLWEYNPQELCEIHAGCDSLAVAQTHPPSGLISRSIHRRRKGTQIKAWCDYCHKPFSREHSTLSRHIELHYKDQMKHAKASVVCDESNESVGQVNDEQRVCSSLHNTVKEEYDA